MNFTTITSSIEMNNFHYSVPAAVKAFKTKPHDDDDEQSKKKQRKSNKRIVNENQVEEWKI